MSKPLKVTSINHLKELIAEGRESYFLLLQGGLKSSKNIRYNKDTDVFTITHYIDGTCEKLSGREFIQSRIRDAIQIGAFFAE